MPFSLSFLLSSDAAAQRMAQRKPRFVVHAEMISGLDRNSDRFQEIDADDLAHAHNLARHWIDKFGAASAAIRRVDPDGSLNKPCHIAA